MYIIRRKNIYACSKTLVSCTFKAEKFKSDGRITYSGPVFSNLILDVGLDLLATEIYSTEIGVGEWINVGESSTAPAQDQTGLISYLASTNSTYNKTKGYNTGPAYKWMERTYEFSVGGCTGNLTEVGLSASANAGYFNRQLFKDDSDNATTITVQSDEGLRITATLYLYPDLEPGGSTSGSFLLNGTDTIDYTKELTSDISSSSWLGEWYMTDNAYALTVFYIDSYLGFDITTSGTDFSGGTGPDSVTKQTYTSGNYYLDFECVWNAETFAGDVASILMYFWLHHNIQGAYAKPFNAFRLTPTISVTDTEELTLMLRRAWGRY